MRGNTNQSFSSGADPGELAPHGTAKDLFAEKIKLYFPNAAPPHYYTDGFEHCLSFMEYEITTAKTFRSQSYAENWLFARAVKIIEEAYRVTTVQIQLEKGQRMAEYGEMRERQSKNRSLSESIRNRARALELEYDLGLRQSLGDCGGAVPCHESVGRQHKNEPPERASPWPGVQSLTGVLQSADAAAHTNGRLSRRGAKDTPNASAEAALAKGAETGEEDVSAGCPQRTNNGFLKNRIDRGPGSGDEGKRGAPNIRARDIDDMLRGNDDFHLGVFSPSESPADGPSMHTHQGDSVLDGAGEGMHGRGRLPGELRRQEKEGHGFASHAKMLDFSDQDDGRTAKRAGHGQEGGRGWRGSAFLKSDLTIPQKEYFNGLMARFCEERHAFIAVIRSFCSFYALFPPEFEIVRENDVYRCTAMFCDMNFVSPYLYDKTDAKNGACKKIYHYIGQNWSAVFVFDHDQKKKAVHAL